MKKSKYTIDLQEKFLEGMAAEYGRDVVSSSEIVEYAKSRKFPTPYFIFRDENRKLARGKYSVAMSVVPMKKLTRAVAPPVDAPAPAAVVAPSNLKLKSMTADISCTVPERDPTYVPFGNYADIEKIIKSKIFFPVYVTGLSGNGKTMSISQACAKLKRELIRINVTEETDELDLIGGTELVDGSTVNREGAVLLAMRQGAVLLIDEGDLNNTKILCLMPILEGKPYFNKKTGEVIHPAEGFNIFITGNTKGKGSEDGRFVGTKVMNEAFLERFSITMEQEYPTAALEKKILIKNMELLNCVDDDFATKLTTWAEIIRKSFAEGAVDEIISTRRLVHIIKTFSIFGERLKAVNLALNRFDDETKNSFVDLYTKVDATANTVTNTAITQALTKEDLDYVWRHTDVRFQSFANQLSTQHQTPVIIREDLINASLIVLVQDKASNRTVNHSFHHDLFTNSSEQTVADAITAKVAEMVRAIKEGNTINTQPNF